MMEIEDPAIRPIYWNTDNLPREELHGTAGLVAYASMIFVNKDYRHI